MIHLTTYDPVIPKEVMQREFGNLDILITDSVKQGMEDSAVAKTLPWKREVRIYSPQNMQKAVQLEQELKQQTRWFTSFDDIGIPNCRFDQSLDMWGRRELVGEWALLITKNALPGTECLTLDEQGADHYSIKKAYLDHLAQFTSGMDRPNLYLALSPKKADREVAKRVVDGIYERFQSKRDRKVQERIGMIKQILSLDYVTPDYTPSPEQPAEVFIPKMHKSRGILARFMD